MAPISATKRLAVLKVGGSLLDVRDLPLRLSAVLSQIDADVQLLFPGGGPTADVVRQWHSDFALSEETSHHLAIAALGVNAQLLARLLGVPLVTTRHPLLQGGTGIGIVDPQPVLSELEDALPVAPPHNWDVTSDSLAAWVALAWGAQELVLLKSRPCDDSWTADDAAAEGLIDPYFPRLAPRVPEIRWCDVRADSPRVSRWLSSGLTTPSQPLSPHC